eukprot:6593115-Pyramimonas_sp.AAC.1
MSQAKVARLPWGRASPRSELRGCLRRKWPDHLGSGHIGTQRCENVLGQSGRATVGQGISEVRVSRMSQATVASPPELMASRKPDLGGPLRRTWPAPMGQRISEERVARMSQANVPDHPSSGHLGTQSCED